MKCSFGTLFLVIFLWNLVAILIILYPLRSEKSKEQRESNSGNYVLVFIKV